MRHIPHHQARFSRQHCQLQGPATFPPRRGSILVLAATVLVIIFIMVAFSVEMGIVALSKTELQIAADAAALGACQELPSGLGNQSALSVSETTTEAIEAAVFVAGRNRNAELPGTFLDVEQDITFGQAVWNADARRWDISWGTPPYNVVRVQARRSSENSKHGDRPLPLAFAKVMGIDRISLTVDSTAALLPGVGLSLPSDSLATIHLLPFALDIGSWENLMAGNGSDEFHFNPETGAITNASDGILEVDLYPYGNHALPPGNRGTVDLGSPNNSTNDLKRQILHGLNAYDLSFFGGVIRTDQGPLILNGDTGLSAGMKAELEAIKGRPRLIPLFSDVSGPGNNAVYTIPRFVGIRIMHVQLTGKTKRVIVQPAPFVSPHVIRGAAEITPDTYYTPPRIIQ